MSDNPESTPPPSPPPPPSADPPGGAAPPPPPSEPPAEGPVSSNRTVMLVLSYLGPFALIPFLMEKEDQEVQWHSKHGLVLLAAEIVFFLLLSIVSSFLAFLTCILYPFISLGLLVLHIVCIVKAVNGQRLLIPGLSMYADRF